MAVLATRPGQDVSGFLEADCWSDYYCAQGAATEKGQWIIAEAEAIGTSYKKALEITGYRPAARAAILGDPLTTEAPRETLLSRPEERAITLAQVLAAPVARKAAQRS
ncbi:hypothetical protein [Actinomadura hibisca]|uniref:hypothetical protein n=1 Tax=Actinomadura hibisca TaxID=68565 RepID=UPI00082B5B21|nr:hypothetical protein [Actinomadura hibisca]